MNRKPTPAAPVIVYAVKHVWRGIYSVKWADLLNYPRSHVDLYRRIGPDWFTGEEHPTGTKAGPLLKIAPPILAAALNSAVHAIAP